MLWANVMMNLFGVMKKQFNLEKSKMRAQQSIAVKWVSLVAKPFYSILAFSKFEKLMKHLVVANTIY
jgi:hypothetical protein